MSTAPEGFESMFAEAMPEFYERLKGDVQEATGTPMAVSPLDNTVCDRCGVMVARWEIHAQYHRDLTLGVNFAQQISVEIAARMKDVIDELDAGDIEAILARRTAAQQSDAATPSAVGSSDD